MYEHKSQKVIGKVQFKNRVVRHLALGLGALFCSLGVGVLGYRYLARFTWIDSILNASMILGGMGPADAILTVEGKLFASFYALFCGLVLIGIAAIMVAPFAHRILHRLHVE